MEKEPDKRTKTRVEFHSTAEIAYKGITIKGPIINLSLKGLFIKTSEKPDIGSHVKVTVRLSGSSTDLSIKIDADIVRIENDGIALEFKEMELDSFVHLRNIVFYADQELHEYLEFT